LRSLQGPCQQRRGAIRPCGRDEGRLPVTCIYELFGVPGYFPPASSLRVSPGSHSDRMGDMPHPFLGEETRRGCPEVLSGLFKREGIVGRSWQGERRHGSSRSTSSDLHRSARGELPPCVRAAGSPRDGPLAFIFIAAPTASSRLLKGVHLRRWRARAALRHSHKYTSPLHPAFDWVPGAAPCI
jgi:hypothetical protein